MSKPVKLTDAEGVQLEDSSAPSTEFESLPSGKKFDIVAGSIAGLVAIGCCVYPVVLVLMGLATAAEAIALGLRLYGVWGWAFKLVGAALGVSAFMLQRRRAAACRVRSSPARSPLTIALVGTSVYFMLYAVTSALARGR
ncbi:MAG: hypothetical protein ACRD1T_01805 [Acidimicrobiia bacterium]